MAPHSFFVHAEYLFLLYAHSLTTLRTGSQFHVARIRRPLERWKKTKWFARECWKPSSPLENRIRRSSAKFDKHRSVASSKLFRMNYLVGAVGIEPYDLSVNS
jgi:hypothetical protein